VKTILIATSNAGKFKEFTELLKPNVETCYSLADFPDIVLPEENGTTFLENALLKARHAAHATGIATLADDSGLEVDALDGNPGVLSARFAGADADDARNNEKLLHELTGVASACRQARFVCCLAYCSPAGECITFDGQLSGFILDAPRGNAGFGYDPLFLVPEFGKTLAELPISIKNRISHRSNAYQKFIAFLAETKASEVD